MSSNVSTWKPTQINSTDPNFKYVASQVSALDPNAQYEAAMWEPDDRSIVEKRITGLLSQDNDYMKQARTSGLQQANARGLLNSSMAAEASQLAAIKSALPIASQDADTFARAGSQNAQAENTARQFNAGTYNQRDLANLGYTNDAGKFNAGNQTNIALANNEFVNEAEKFNAGEKNTSNRLASELASRERVAAASVQASQAIAASNVQAANIQAQAAREAAVLTTAGSIMSGGLNSHNEYARIVENSDLPPETKAQLITNDAIATRNTINLTGSVLGIPQLDTILGDFGAVP